MMRRKIGAKIINYAYLCKDMFNFRFLHMKRILFFVILASALSSCAVQRATSKSDYVQGADVMSVPMVSSLEVGEKITYEYVPVRNDRKKLSRKELRENAVAYALKEAGDADVLLEPQFVFNYRKGYKYRRITVTGYPAKYVFREPTDFDLKVIATFRAPDLKHCGGRIIKMAYGRKERK